MTDRRFIAFDRAVDRLARWRQNGCISLFGGVTKPPVNLEGVNPLQRQMFRVAAAKILREITVEVPDAD